ncbi:hypothetical protein Gasu2_38490 [Galdieria sulphuraria]|uniref:Uncharacterized protein n=1 Tax=Galdieria sulphuraria TaxID=130081 RepID=M2W8H4_GALSU|nr:uncharacterized protein Gasu_05940 [Galdieria sulphuraria]EME32181.1 hypothetical protein Gasu_05940 [Galdieria sulphuraria]GJD09605.1 hypothetical protein Gasu2_38490 [Galdieria sulphuraria]|eukprot:XP_005708701.1 hypothetical protein Gasu_05940 [Galdieria sulphuraria]
MDREQQQLLLKRLSDLKTPQKTVKRILDALESKDRIIDSLTTRAQVADELQSQCDSLKATVEAKIRENELLAWQLQQKQEQLAHLERLVEFLEQQTSCRTKQLSVQQRQQNAIQQHMEAKQKQQNEDWISCVAELKYELAAAKAECISVELRNSELEEQIHLLSEDKAHVMQYYEERLKQMNEDLKQEQNRSKSQLVEFQKRLEELENCKSLENTIGSLSKDVDKSTIRQSPRRNMPQSSNHSLAICNSSREKNLQLESTCSSLQPVESSEDTETVLREIEHSKTKRKSKKALKCGQISSPLSAEVSSYLVEETEQHRVEMMDAHLDGFKENQGNVHNISQTVEDAPVLPTKKYKEDHKKRRVNRKVKGTHPKSYEAAESDSDKVQTKRKKKMASEKDKKSAASTKDASFGLYSVRNDISSGDSWQGPSYPNSALSSLQIPQLAFSMTKDGKVVFDAFKP